MNSVTEYLDRVDPEWMADHRAGNRRMARGFLVVSVAALAPFIWLAWTFADSAVSGSAWWWFGAAGEGFIAASWLYFFIIRQVVYTLRTGDFR